MTWRPSNIRAAFPEELSDEQVDKLIFDMWVHLFRLLVGNGAAAQKDDAHKLP